MKVCGVCKQPKPLDAFYHQRGKPESLCKECRKARGRAWYAANKTRHQTFMKRWWANNPDKRKEHKQRAKDKIQAHVRQLKEGRPCQDCGEPYPYWVMQFDHRPGTVKVGEMGRMSSRHTTMAQVKREIAKCDLVCAVCHAHRTYCRDNNVERYILH